MIIFAPRGGFSSLRLLLRDFSLHKLFTHEIEPSGCGFVLLRSGETAGSRSRVCRKKVQSPNELMGSGWQ